MRVQDMQRSCTRHASKLGVQRRHLKSAKCGIFPALLMMRGYCSETPALAPGKTANCTAVCGTYSMCRYALSSLEMQTLSILTHEVIYQFAAADNNAVFGP